MFVNGYPVGVIYAQEVFSRDLLVDNPMGVLYMCFQLGCRTAEAAEHVQSYNHLIFYTNL
jgi:hypothetical protein